MLNLDDPKAIAFLDKLNVVGSIEQLGLQCEQAWQEAKKIQFPSEYKHAQNIVFSGMGGSALGAYVVKSLFFDSLLVPLEIVNDYHLPKYVNQKSLVILSSYSGTTEETLNVAKEAIDKKSMLTGLTAGGKLGQIFKEHKASAYVYAPKYNPSGQPRMGLGYPIFGLLAILDNLGFIEVNDQDILEIKELLTKGNLSYGIKTLESKNQAKKLAQKWYGKMPVIVAAQYLTNVGRVVRNQLHECSKNFANFYDVPELNHHLMEGLKNPKANKKLLTFLFLNSSNYSEKIKKRMAITQDVVKKNGVHTETFTSNAKGRVVQALECMQFASYVNYYLALLYKIDPSKIPWVDYFKAQLVK